MRVVCEGSGSPTEVKNFRVVSHLREMLSGRRLNDSQWAITVGALGATLPGNEVTGGKALAMEIVLTAGLARSWVRRPARGTSARTAPSPWVGILLWLDFGRRRLLVRRCHGRLDWSGFRVAFEWILKGKSTGSGGIAAQGTLGADDPAGPDT